jgi:diadenosine tetraphosphate (Ap4A) HIT family hydrolase
MGPCPFCRPDELDVVADNDHAFAFRDAYPVSRDHTLIVPRRHVASYFDLTTAEQAAMMTLLRVCRDQLAGHHDAFNWGVNDGPAAGQTVLHCHLHLIPRRAGDVPDPRGGIRWVLPDKAAYWSDGAHE